MKKDHIIFTILYLLIIHFSKYFNYVYLNATFVGRIDKLLILILITLLVTNIKYFSSAYFNKNALSKNYVFWLGIFPIISSISCLITRDQSFFHSLWVINTYFILFSYYLLHRYKIKPEICIRAILLIAVIRVLILTIQQFTYPDYSFGGVQEGEESLYGSAYQVEIRSGIYRYWVSAFYTLIITGLYSWIKYIKTYKTIYLFIFIFCSVGLYLDQSRTVIVLFLLCILFSLFTKANNKKLVTFTIIGLFAFFLLANSDVLFNELLERTKDDTSNQDYIRLLAYKFYFFDFWEGSLTWFFGNGVPNPLSSYGQEIINIQKQRSLFTYDIGIVGALSTYGIIFIVIYISFFFRIFLKYWKSIDDYLKLFLLFTLLYLPFYFPIHYLPGENITWAILFYLIDKSIQKNRDLQSVQYNKLTTIQNTK